MLEQAAALTPGEAACLLQACGTQLTAELEALPEEALAWHPAPSEWCVKEALGHIVEAERRGFAGRIRILLAGEDPQLETWDQEAVAVQRKDCGRDLGMLLAEFKDLRAASVELAANLRLAQLARGGHHPEVGYLRVIDLLHEWVHHDRNHFRQILANVQAYVWPNMGNARRFSEIEG